MLLQGGRLLPSFKFWIYNNCLQRTVFFWSSSFLTFVILGQVRKNIIRDLEIYQNSNPGLISISLALAQQLHLSQFFQKYMIRDFDACTYG